MLVPRVHAWLPDLAALKDDSEEDLVGADWHQDAIDTTFEGLWLAGPEEGLPWKVSRQLMVLMGDLGPKRDWRPSPDILVHPTAGTAPLSSFDAAALGVPPLLIEVASPGTFEYDASAKRDGYMVAGVLEYLLFDPTGELLGGQVRAWRAVPGGFTPWLPADDGRWHSTVIPVSFLPEGLLLRVYDAEGRRMPTLREAALRADAEQRRADDAALRADAEQRRADDAARRAEQAEQRADALARRLAALEAQLQAHEGGEQNG